MKIKKRLITSLPVPSRTQTRWVVDILQKASIHNITFKIDFLRSTSTSNVFSGDPSLAEIEKAAGWANVKTFGKFFNKPVIEKNFGNFLLTISLQIYAYR